MPSAIKSGNGVNLPANLRDVVIFDAQIDVALLAILYGLKRQILFALLTTQ